MTLIDLNEQNLRELKLDGMRESLARRLKQAQRDGLGLEDFLGLLIHDEIENRKNKRLARLLKVAAFKQSASLEAFDLAVPRGIEKRDVNDLAMCRFVRDGEQIIIIGPTGAGKSYLASALGNAACRSGYTTLFFRMNALIEQLALARVKGTYLNILKRLACCDLLILDDFGIKPLTPHQYQDLYDILDERGDHRSTIVTTQVPIGNWNEIIKDPVCCEAVTDRLASRAKHLQLSLRKGKSCRGQNLASAEVILDKH
jgi:DNA replication protein DnaC